MMDNKRHKKALFIFRRDLRLDDNTALLNALKLSETLIPCFIFDPRQIESSNNEYKSNNALQFMIESLYDLEEQILSLGKKIDNNNDNNVFCRLYLFYGEQENVVSELLIKEKLNAVFTKAKTIINKRKKNFC